MMMVCGARTFCGNIMLHANHAVGMMVMWNSRHTQHDNADQEEKIDYVSFILHGVLLQMAAKIVYLDVKSKCLINI